jgi:polyhydroxyalkanoate synthase
MQNFFLENLNNLERNNNLMRAFYQYQQGLTIMLNKLSQNKLFQTIEVQSLTKFFLENNNLIQKPFNYPWEDFMTQIPLLNQSKNPQAFFQDLWQISYDNYQQAFQNWLDPKLTTSNFLWPELNKFFNPKFSPIFFQEEIMSDKGEKLLKGSQLFLEDAINSPDGHFLIKTVDKSAFTLGKDLAATPGKVVFRNDLLELIAYDQPKEKATPILITMAWINKFYILDLEPRYSFVKWLTDQGYQVFMVSWVNPDASKKNLSLEDYMIKGLLEALNEVKKITGEEEINCLGYCMGGTLLAILAAYLAQEKEKGIKSLTLLTSLTDFTKVGPVEILIQEGIISAIEKDMSEKGYLAGEDLFTTFSSLKSSDMIWYYFINRYLLGKEAKPLEVLYWNSDSTRIPYKLHSDCLRKLYQKNLLAEGKLILDGRKIDLKAINIALYFFATEDDHIAPWDSVYKGLTLLGSKKKRFILSQSGHVAAVINHPDKKKYGYWYQEGQEDNIKITPEKWLEKAKFKEGSWWQDWQDWMKSSGLNNLVNKIVVESLGEAPGNYVKVK